MAITKLLRIKETNGANRASHLKRNIAYICNPDKTSGGVWVGGNAGTNPDIIYQTMMLNKNYWGKEGGTQGFHYVLSFPPELDIDEAKAYRIAEEFSQELLGGSFYYCIAVHNDKDHLHTHITFDSVSKVDGYKFHSPKGDWEKRIQPITDRICRKYSIPTLDYSKEETKGMDYGSWQDGQRSAGKRKRKKADSGDDKKFTQANSGGLAGMNDGGTDGGRSDAGTAGEAEYMNQEDDIPKYSWYDIIRDDIDDAIEASNTYEEFLNYLRQQHYELRDKKYLSLRPFGKDRNVRSQRLGEEYGKERIRERIAEKKEGREFRRYGDYKELQKNLRRYKEKNGDPTVYQKQFYYRFVFTVNIRHPVFYDCENWKYKQDVLNLYLYNRQINYVLRNGIRSREDAEKKHQELAERLREINKKKRKLQSSIRLESNYYRMKKLLAIQGEIEKYPEGTREDLMGQAKELIKRISLSETLEESLDRFNSINEVITDLDLARKKTIAELKHLESILGVDFRKRDYRQFRETRTKTDAEQTRRITINRILFEEGISREGFRVIRVPGMKEYVAIPKRDTIRLSDVTISASIHLSESYSVLNKDGREIKMIRGRNLMEHFDDRTRKKTKDNKKSDGKRPGTKRMIDSID